MTIQNKPTIYNAPTIYKIGGGGTPPTPPPEPDPDLYQIGNAFRCTEDFNFYVNALDTRTEINKDDIIELKYWTNQKDLNTNAPISLFGCNRTSTNNLYRTVGIIDNVNSFYLTAQNGGTTNNQFRVNGSLHYPLGVKQQGNKTIIGGIEKNTTQSGTYTTWIRFLYDNTILGFVSVLYPLIIKDSNENEKYKFYPVIRKQDNYYGFFEPHINIFVPYSTVSGTIELI